ncbi:BadF/BadG/BcrA/BcrD ATPase family protein [Streptomyces sp. NPDC051940]|uniref:N-acetylglucosamine kinase n=1 Tax=Streptomyces sp. NPDC051940 TaxID=3155675 RepID=UPI003418B799
MSADLRPHVLGIDSGGSGVRIAIAPASAADGTNATDATDGADATDTARNANRTDAPTATAAVATPALVGPRGIDAASLLDLVLPAAGKLLSEHGVDTVHAICVGAAGMATLGGDLRDRLPQAFADAYGARTRLALAADGVTAYVGALGQRRGAVVAAGTGMIALGTGLDAHGWRRADGWGHLLGDCGGGAWIGRAGLEAAMRAHDGRDGGSPALLARLEAVFGPAGDMPGKLYPRPDRPAVLASFAPEVAACAPHDPVARGILEQAARDIVAAAAAVCPEGGTVSFTGGLLKMGAPLTDPLQRALRERLPGVAQHPAEGDPLLGAVRIARALAADDLRVPVQPHGLLHIA